MDRETPMHIFNCCNFRGETEIKRLVSGKWMAVCFVTKCNNSSGKGRKDWPKPIDTSRVQEAEQIISIIILLVAKRTDVHNNVAVVYCAATSQ